MQGAPRKDREVPCAPGPPPPLTRRTRCGACGAFFRGLSMFKRFVTRDTRVFAKGKMFQASGVILDLEILLNFSAHHNVHASHTYHTRLERTL